MLTQKELKEVLDYDPDTGDFTWKMSVRGRKKKGDVAGSPTKKGYIKIQINKKGYYAHRLAHLYMMGYFPEYQMDHKKGVKDDNRWEEIRHTTQVCNSQNHKMYKSNTTGFPGVSGPSASGKFITSIRVNGDTLQLGTHSGLLETALVRLTCEVWHPGWTCNHRSELVEAIKEAWPGFNNRCLD